ncbi:MAG: hypothetical protein AB7K37_14085 [Cyclobacteriaceae bacterium]
MLIVLLDLIPGRSLFESHFDMTMLKVLAVKKIQPDLAKSQH